MNKIVDFKCIYQDSLFIDKAITKDIDVDFPEAYKHWDSMVLITKELKKHDNIPFCQLPFCHTLEGEAMGGIINLGDEHIGPRANDYIVNSLEDLLELPSINYSQGRISEVLKACKHLRENGENVMLSISGPFTIMNVLIDPRYVFKTFKKNPDIMEKVLNKFKDELILFINHAQKAGVNLISYADSSGGMNILGPKFSEQVVEMFTYPFLKQVEEIIKKDEIVVLCPKTTLALIGTQNAVFEDISLQSNMKYSKACVEVIGKTKFIGQMCIKNREFELKDMKIKSLKLL